jgi:hypothetical protein
MLKELLPSPVLSIGLTGHRQLDSGLVGAIELALGTILEMAQRALAPAIAPDQAYFAATMPTARLVTMAAEGADLLGARAAGKYGLALSCVLPFPWSEYRHDFSPTYAALAEDVIAHAASVVELPGTRQEGPRAYERANEVILSNVDLLLAVWDGERARGPGGTADVVHGAVARRIPIIVIDPKSPAASALLVAPPRDVFETPPATDLSRSPLPADLTDFLHTIVRPPAREVQRQAFADLISETPRTRVWRFEYPLLLRIAGRALPRRPSSPLSAKIEQPTPDILPDRPAAHATRAEVAKLERARNTIDILAVQYGRLFRSSSVSAYFVVILGSWVSGVIGLLVPALSEAAIAIQFVANWLVLADATFRARHRWQERWLDYRIVAERLRWLGFSHSFGLGSERQSTVAFRRNASWTDWYLQRMARAVGPPHGRIDATVVAAAAAHLSDVEIPGQISYHRATFRRLSVLERRLSYAAHGALLASVTVAVLLAVAAARAGSLAAVGWKPLAIALLAMLPATMTALNGYRVDSDLIRLVERSAQTIAALFSIRRAIIGAPCTYDQVAADMQRLAAVMAGELADWRFVIESRRARGQRRRTIRKRQTLFRIARRPRNR